ncbi:MAG: hypothetical protein B7Y00_04365 [Sphingomonadales bacterium 17-56-6]|jgi:hypothetical protein|nr:MAG: hypothetical protein B7Y44_07605 [Sphingomonadales bacterium 28-55-16]OYZ88482.1 MAG: hypothetical protein B7Y00_04365 [Sphingomonadales bacterium 17-56-6]
MKVQRVLLIIAVAMTATACGKVGDLDPRTGNSMPPAAYGQRTAQTAEILSTSSVQARPDRTDELLKRSDRREDDPFDVPPGEEPIAFNPEQPTQSAKTSPE